MTQTIGSGRGSRGEEQGHGVHELGEQLSRSLFLSLCLSFRVCKTETITASLTAGFSGSFGARLSSAVGRSCALRDTEQHPWPPIH